ncbi:hypothetical protein DL768_002183 [Monosporascus sp. mg162]|nr:hypothetical protein DL768_002183 [Monosporascus sp. mg162]
MDLPSRVSRLSTAMTSTVRLTSDLDDARDNNMKMLLTAVPLTLWHLMSKRIGARTMWRTASDQVCARKGDSLPMLFCYVKNIHAEVGDLMNAPNGLGKRVGHTGLEPIRKENDEWFFKLPRNS